MYAYHNAWLCASSQWMLAPYTWAKDTLYIFLDMCKEYQISIGTKVASGRENRSQKGS